MKRQLGCVLKDRSGATALLFSVSAVTFIGLSGLATEGGTWYLERRHGQNTADAAAVAGTLAIANGGNSSAAQTAGTNVATLNGYTAGTANRTTTTVTITPGNYAGGAFTAGGAPLNATKADITRSPPRLFSALFLAANPSIGETAVAALMATGANACSLALGGGLSFGGSTAITANNCTLASNRTGGSSISFNGTGNNKAQVTGGTLLASGGCNVSGGTNPCAGAMLYQPPTTDPYLGIQSLTMPPKTASAATCQNMPTLTGTVTLTSAYTMEGGGKMFCTGTFGGTKFTGDLQLVNSSASVLDLAPGTYVFYNASISVLGGTLKCSQCTPGGNGVTIILTGSPASKIGTLSVGGNATVNLNAPAVNSYNTAFDGVLFYVDKNAQPTNGNGNAAVSLQGNGNIHLTGGMYFPSVNVNYSGDLTSASACTELVAYSITYSGNSTVAVNGCSGIGTPVPQVRAVEMVL